MELRGSVIERRRLRGWRGGDGRDGCTQTSNAILRLFFMGYEKLVLSVVRNNTTRGFMNMSSI